MKKLFVSRDLEPTSPLRGFERYFNLFATSLITFEPIPLTTHINSSWLFFYSKNGVKYLKEANPEFNVKMFKIGCLGKGTSKTFEILFKKSPEFIGTGDPEEVVEKFSQILKPSDSITFLCALQSRNSIQIGLKGKFSTKSIPIYSNKINSGVNFPKPNIGIFTSPLNVDAYGELYPLDQLELVIAIGKTTAKYLHNSGVKQVIIACEPSDQGLSLALEIATIQNIFK